MKIIFKFFMSFIFLLAMHPSYAQKHIIEEVTELPNDVSIQTDAEIAAAEAACRASANCDVASDVLEEERYGGIEKEYTVKGCKVTIYKDGPIKMENIKTGKFCNAPIPENHDFGGTSRVYQEDGCTVTETTLKNGLAVAEKDCP